MLAISKRGRGRPVVRVKPVQVHFELNTEVYERYLSLYEKYCGLYDSHSVRAFWSFALECAEGRLNDVKGLFDE